MNEKCSQIGAYPLKLAEITPIHKKKDPLDQDNYRSMSILPLIAKVFEKNYIQTSL